MLFENCRLPTERFNRYVMFWQIGKKQHHGWGWLRGLACNVLQLSNRLPKKEQFIVAFGNPITIVSGIGFNILLCPKMAYPFHSLDYHHGSQSTWLFFLDPKHVGFNTPILQNSSATCWCHTRWSTKANSYQKKNKVQLNLVVYSLYPYVSFIAYSLDHQWTRWDFVQYSNY